MKKIIFYGDSNTYGYDPRGFFGLRYPAQVRWTEQVRARFKEEYEIIEEGQNGRCLPVLPREEGFLEGMTKELTAGDVLVVMLGTNDILLTSHPDAEAAVSTMEQLLLWLKEKPFITLIIGPVPIADDMEELRRYHEESIRLNEGYKALCERFGISFVDAAEWGISLTFDGVHFSEEGCRKFAARMIGVISE